MFCLVCLGPWAVRYLFDQMVYANNVVCGEWLFLLWEVGVWVAEVRGATCIYNWSPPCPPAQSQTWTLSLRWAALVDSTFPVLHTLLLEELSISVYSTRKGPLEACTLFLLKFTLCTFLFGDFNLYPFVKINHIPEYNSLCEYWEPFQWVIEPDGGLS